MVPETLEGAYTGPFAPIIQLMPRTPPEVMLGNARSALKRGLPEVQRCNPHGHVLNIAAGGPSLQDTYPKLGGYIAAVNGSLGYLLERGIVPHACAVFDPGKHMAEALVADKRVRYFIGSTCAPEVFDKLEGCNVHLWHPVGCTGLDGLVQLKRPDNWLMISGGCSIALRWFTLGYVLGFRKFSAHGLDSSFRGGSTHAYPDRADSKERFVYNGRETRLNFVQQVYDFQFMIGLLTEKMDINIHDIEIHGDGLLQDFWHGRGLTHGG